MQISSESVKVGHPDLVADIIAANVIAEILDGERKEKDGLNLANMPHCGIEVFLGKGICLVGGEVQDSSLCRYRSDCQGFCFGVWLQSRGSGLKRTYNGCAQCHHSPVAGHQPGHKLSFKQGS